MIQRSLLNKELLLTPKVWTATFCGIPTEMHHTQWANRSMLRTIPIKRIVNRERVIVKSSDHTSLRVNEITVKLINIKLANNEIPAPPKQIYFESKDSVKSQVKLARRVSNFSLITF